MADRTPRVLIDNSHEFLFQPPFNRFCRETLGWDVSDTRVGLRPEILKGFDLVVVYSGEMSYMEAEKHALLDYQGGLIVARSEKQFAKELLEFLPSRTNMLIVASETSDEYIAQQGGPDVVRVQLEGLVAGRVGDTDAYQNIKNIEPKKIEGDGFFIRHPDSLDDAKVARLAALAMETYNLVSDEFGYKHDDQPMDITALLCAGSGYQASKHIVGIGCLGGDACVRSVLIHEFSNSLCYELSAMGGDAGWSSYVQEKVKRALGWHSQSTEQINQEATKLVHFFEEAHCKIIDPSSEQFYGSGVPGCTEALIAKWKMLYTGYELAYGDHFMHKYFANAREFSTQLMNDGWNRVHDRMVVYMSLATGKDETERFQALGYWPTRYLDDELACVRAALRVDCCGCEGHDRPRELVRKWYSCFLPECAEGLRLRDDGVQVYNAPPGGGMCAIQLAGAAGGSASQQIGGRGAVLQLEVELHDGDELHILAGQRASGCTGGGGASVLWLAREGKQELLAIAGGGGAQDASLTEDGIDSRTHDGKVKEGTGGRGGCGGKGQNGQGGQGGAGWLGGSETWAGKDDPEGPRALSETLEPGYRFNPQFNSHTYGGLGGGGAEWYASGGGGGYSGGGGAECYGKSGGGGSFVAKGVHEMEERRVLNTKSGYATIKSASGTSPAAFTVERLDSVGQLVTMLNVTQEVARTKLSEHNWNMEAAANAIVDSW